MKKDSTKIDPKKAGSEHPEGDGESFGAWLRRQRLGRDIELPEIAESSKINLQYLKAFESDRFDLLPAEVFAKGFLRQYAGYVGLDPEEVVNFFLTASQAEQEEKPEELQPKVMSSGSSRGFVAILVVVIGLLVAVVWWLSRSDQGPLSGQSATESSATVAGSPAAPPRQGASATTVADEPLRSVAAGTGAPSPSSPSPPSMTAPGAGADVASRAEPTAPPSSRTKADGLKVVAEFSDSCWVEARVDGERRVAITKVQGESLLLQADTSVDFVFGNVFAVRLEVNGRPFPLTPRRGTSRLAVRIDKSSMAPSLPGTSIADGDGGNTP